jgi:hypothetical protein
MATCARRVYSRNSNIAPLLCGDYVVSYQPHSNRAKAYPQKAKWCNDIIKTGKSRHKTGLQYMTKRDLDCGSSGSSCSCDLCGKNSLHGRIHQNEDLVCLCSDCLNHLEVLPDGKIKESIENFLIGNVL